MAESRTQGSMQIGEVAERTEMSLRTLRHYDEVGLLRPSTRSEGGFRLYSQEDVDKLLVIRRMKPLGFSLDEMHDVMRTIEQLRESQHDPAARSGLADIIKRAAERREHLSTRLAMADEFIELLIKQIH